MENNPLLFCHTSFLLSIAISAVSGNANNLRLFSLRFSQTEMQGGQAEVFTYVTLLLLCTEQTARVV